MSITDKDFDRIAAKIRRRERKRRSQAPISLTGKAFDRLKAAADSTGFPMRQIVEAACTPEKLNELQKHIDKLRPSKDDMKKRQRVKAAWELEGDATIGTGGGLGDHRLWEIVCPDGRVRHYPFHNEDDAKADAAPASSQRCRLWSEPSDLETSQSPCPEGEHAVRPVVKAVVNVSGQARPS